MNRYERNAGDPQGRYWEVRQVASRASAMYEADGRQVQVEDLAMDLAATAALESIDWRAFLDAPDPQFVAALAWCRASRERRERWKRRLPEFIHQRQAQQVAA